MKRSRNEHNSSQEEQEFLRESKLVARSPQHKEKVKQPEPSMDEIKQMLRDLKKDLHEDMAQIKREIQNDIREMREDIKDTKKELQKNREEMKSMAKEITQMKEEWTREKEELHNKIKEVEDKMERMEKQKIRNDLTITGLPTNTDNEDTLEEALEKMFQTELLLKTKIRRAQKIGQDRCIVEMVEWNDKIKILQGKAKLKGKDIFIDSELTRNEQKIQKKIRDIAREEKKKGAIVKVGYQKLEVNGKKMKWDHRSQKLTEANKLKN
ncbi:uncharacterized protein PF3D7_1120000-like [Diabrotica virgifera virgifera]|uniref:Uncharacterized protein n=1 Tax=Diabrotica virgifera virgifera TaxID=50390 RepID=A0ABM5L2I3_DIAVI|nr:uncharacterized protein PF3D7_1120000-like [Diabrotica virgifera virgifera]